MRIPRKVLKTPLQEELGFGKNVTTDGRMMNPDGSFNVRRKRTSIWDNTYYHLITMPWVMFFGLVFSGYILLNLIFSLIYLGIGIESLSGLEQGPLWKEFLHAFFFSTQTLTTVGYGFISPQGISANLVASLESFLGLLAFALISGLLYGRFSRPSAKIVFSENILVAPYGQGQALMFRMGNARKSELIETEVQVILAINQRDESGGVARRFFTLKLEIPKVSFFSLSWTVVHALVEDSPLFGFSEADITDANAELLVLVKGTDEANQQMVHARRSYSVDEFVWNARFSPVIRRSADGLPEVITQLIGRYESLKPPGADGS